MDTQIDAGSADRVPIVREQLQNATSSGQLQASRTSPGQCSNMWHLFVPGSIRNDSPAHARRAQESLPFTCFVVPLASLG